MKVSHFGTMPATVEKALDLLFLFRRTPVLSVDEIGAALGMPKSTTYRFLRTLVGRGLLAPVVNGHYRLGLALLELGHLAARQLNLVEIGAPLMRELASRSGETVLLSVRSGHVGVCLERVESTRLIRLSLDRGTPQPLHCGAPMKVLLAYLDRADQEAMIRRGLRRYTRHTITRAPVLRRHLATIVRRGHAYSDQEYDMGARAVAAPIRDHTGAVVASLGIAGPVDRFRGRRLRELTCLVVNYAARFSTSIGYPPGESGKADEDASRPHPRAHRGPARRAAWRES